MSVLSSKALHEQLSVIMGALTKAAVAEICEVVDEGYAVLQMEISRSHKENDDLRKKLHLIESIVVRGSCGGKKAEPGVVVAAAEGSKQAGTPQQQQRGDDGGDTAAAGGGDGGAAVFLREELPDVVLIKDEDSDSNDTFEGEGDKAPADRATAAARESATSSPTGRSMKRPWPGNEDAERKSSSELTLISPTTSKQTQKKSVSVYSLDSPRSEPGCSAQLGGDEMEAGGELVCSYSSQMDPDIHLVHQECSLVPPMSSASRQVYYANSTLIDSQSQSTDGAELDLTPTWSKQSKSHMAFAQFHQNENMDGDAFGLKLINVSGSTPTDCQLSESSNSAFGYDEADTMNFAVYRDQSGPSQRCNGAGKVKRFICSICNKTYATSQNLDVHMRIHTGERPFSCSQCGKKFTQSAHLKSHLSIHSGERPYACTRCSRSFIVKYSLTLHMKKCHPDV